MKIFKLIILSALLLILSRGLSSCLNGGDGNSDDTNTLTQQLNPSLIKPGPPSG